jgi:hypothetical protein
MLITTNKVNFKTGVLEFGRLMKLALGKLAPIWGCIEAELLS